MALTQISTQGIKDGTISSADLADQSVTLAKLPHGTSSNDGKFLRANNGADPTFETVSSIGGGTGVDFDDNVKARFGNSQDLQIFHDSNNSFISESGTGNLVISTTSGSIRIEKNTGEPMIFANVDGAVELYHDGSKKFHTFSEGVTLFGDVFFDNPINAGKDLEWDASQDRLEFKDGVSAVFGASADLQIYHSSNESRIQNTTDKPLKIINGGNAGMLIQNQNSFDLEIKTNAEDAIKCIANAGVELYHNGNKKFETTSSGVTLRGTIHRFEGTLRPNNATGSDIGTSDDRIRDIYVYNDIDIKDNGKLLLGDSNDLEIYHDGTDDVIHSTGTSLRTRSNIFRANNAANTAVMFRSFADGAFEAYHNGSKKFETTSDGVEVFGVLQMDDGNSHIKLVDSGRIDFGNNADLRIFHDNNGNNKISTSAALTIQTISGSEPIIDMSPNGGVSLYHDNSKKFETTSSGVTVTGIAAVPDGSEISFGNSNDLIIRHIAGSRHEILGSASASLQVRCDETIFVSENGNEDLFRAVKNGAFAAYFDASKKFETASYGAVTTGTFQATGNIEVFDNGKFIAGTHADLQFYHNNGNNFIYAATNSAILIGTNNTHRWTFDTNGHFKPAANDTFDIGTSSARVRNIYTNDLNLSNEGGFNDVDGTWGSYTIQEGAEDLFLVNKRNGKKYKFNLTEVS